MSPTKKGQRSKHFRNEAFLKALGHHCQRLRSQQGFSIDRLAKESDQLSTSVIHRLETGSGAVTVSALFRYAEGLSLEPRALLDFSYVAEPPVAHARLLIPSDDPQVRREAFKTLLPVYSLKAAAGYFGSGEDVVPKGWIRAERAGKLNKDLFVVQAKGDSMLPDIRDGDYLVFRARPTGSRQGKVVLVQYRGPADPETGGSYTVKRYQSAKVADRAGSWRHQEITLSPSNPDYEPIRLAPQKAEDFKVIGELVAVI